MLQKQEFLKVEANSWFERNKSVVVNKSYDDEMIVNLIKAHKINPQRVLEIGCSAGYRLNHLKQEYHKCEVWGIDPSTKAIQYGLDNYPDVDLRVGTMDALDQFEDGFFDLVIVGFVFYVVDRPLLMRGVSEIDRVLKNEGALIIEDFYSVKPKRNAYKHIIDFDAYSYKMDYFQIFLSTQMYILNCLETFSHDGLEKNIDSDYDNKISLTLLKKDLVANFI
jgi:ubiquinone/menaquinone biosynthesis C-methylase UbiE